MKPTEWPVLCGLARRRVARLRDPFHQIHLALVALLVFSVVIVLGLLGPSVLVRPVLSSSSEHPVLVGNDRSGHSLAHLKIAIQSIRQQKRNILLNQMSQESSLGPVALNLTRWGPSAGESTVSSVEATPDSTSQYITDGIYWSDKAESIRPKGFSTRDDLEWLNLLARSQVAQVVSGCGRMQCRLLRLSTGQKVCARYRKNNDQILGEYHSFLLSRLLNITNVPPSALVSFGGDSDGTGTESLWRPVRGQLEQEAHWEGKPVVLTKFVDHLGAAFIPSGLRTSHRRLLPAQAERQLSAGEIVELVQWSDLIVLDYLTANLDRMLNNMINERWNHGMMDSPAHNLLHQEHSNLLLFLDNESGLFHGYRLLTKYESLHRSLLDALCVFRRPTVRQLEKLLQLSEAEFASLLKHSYRQHSLPRAAPVTLPPKSNLVVLRRRMAQVLQQVDRCGAKQGARQ